MLPSSANLWVMGAGTFIAASIGSERASLD
jgi:hypothetical protein